MKPEELKQPPANLPVKMWMIENSHPIQRAPSFYTGVEVEKYLWPVMVEKRTEKGWRGFCMKYSQAMTSSRMFLDENFTAYASKPEAIAVLMAIAHKRREEIEAQLVACEKLIGDIALASEQSWVEE